MEYRKVYVDVSVDISKDGTIRPRWLKYENGTIYIIDELKDVRQSASVKVGGSGTRYTVTIQGHESYLFDEDGRWFVEGRQG